MTLLVKPTIPAAATKFSKLRPGLRYTYYEASSGIPWKELPDFAALKPVKQGIVKTPDDTLREDRDKLYAMRYQGFIRAPETGLYVLELGTCDGSRLSIDGRVVSDNDGIHGTSVKQYSLALDQGLHPFELSYFKGPESYLADKILLAWEGPGFEFRNVLPADFVCEDDSDTPSIAMPLGDFSKGALEDNLVNIAPLIDRRGHRVNKVQFYRDRLLLRTALNDDPSGAGDMAFRNLLPAGDNNLWARLWYDDRNSIDSNVLALRVENKTEGAWTFDNFGEKFPLAVRSHEGTISFCGERNVFRTPARLRRFHPHCPGCRTWFAQ